MYLSLTVNNVSNVILQIKKLKEKNKKKIGNLTVTQAYLGKKNLSPPNWKYNIIERMTFGLLHVVSMFLWTNQFETSTSLPSPGHLNFWRFPFLRPKHLIQIHTCWCSSASAGGSVFQLQSICCSCFVDRHYWYIQKPFGSPFLSELFHSQIMGKYHPWRTPQLPQTGKIHTWIQPDGQVNPVQ